MDRYTRSLRLTPFIVFFVIQRAIDVMAFGHGHGARVLDIGLILWIDGIPLVELHAFPWNQSNFSYIVYILVVHCPILQRNDLFHFYNLIIRLIIIKTYFYDHT